MSQNLQRCRECGCTDHRPCIDEETGDPCYWIEPDLCSLCAQPIVQTYSEAQASQFIRAMRQEPTP